MHQPPAGVPATDQRSNKTDLLFSIICGACLALGFGSSFLPGIPHFVSLLCYSCSYFFGGYFAAVYAWRSVIHGHFEIDFLMLVAAIGAAILGTWAEGGLLLLLFSMGNALEHYALEKAKRSIRALTQLAPVTALQKKNGVLTEVPIATLQPGDIIVAKPNTKIAADGIVIMGSSTVNQAPITGESIPVDKTAVLDPAAEINLTNSYDSANRVFAATLNGNGTLEIKVTKKASDSTLARIVKMVTEAQAKKSPTQQFTDRVEKYYVPAILILVTLLCLSFLVIDEPFSKSFYRAMSVLIGASPCALAISTPSAILSGIARAAREGVLIKGGRPLEDLGTLHVVAVDKTGTLTEGNPKLNGVFPQQGITENELLSVAIAVESLSDHSLAKAVVRFGRERIGNTIINPAQNVQAVLGKGIKATLNGDEIYAGNLAMFEKLDQHMPSPALVQAVHQLEEQGNTTMLFRKNADYIGIIALMDLPRPEALSTMQKLKRLGITKIIMLSGDNQKVADAVAAQTGITDARGSLLPDQKAAVVAQLVEENEKVAMIGDGVNDAPAMAKCTVGIAMGAAGSDVALETADVALLGDRLTLLPFAIGLSRKTKKIIRQNLAISLGMVALLIPLTIMNFITIGPAVIGHEGSTVVVVLNALRLLAYRHDT